MATRSIVTSQPDVECDVCDRRLLRGEQPDVFLAAGRRHLVCELCAPRAVQEGWLRETDGQASGPPATRPRRRRGLLERLATPFRARPPARPVNGAVEARSAQLPRDRAEGLYDFLDGQGRAAVTGATPIPARAPEPLQTPFAGDVDDARFAHHEPALGGQVPAPDDRELPPGPDLNPLDPQLEHAVATFNASEHPRRVAGVGRALGPPAVSVRHSEHARSVATIVVAWELCWYRYEVDLDQAPPAARAVAQGSELGELVREECVANAVADESGTLRLSDAHADPRQGS
jgi:hypothetical protein